jgi:large subunit ribosomal protein L17
MRNRKKGRKLSLKADQRKALLRSLAEALFIKEKIKTTEAKAKEVSIFAERMITEAKKKNPSSVRRLARFFSGKLVKKISTDIAARYDKRNGGYTRVIKLGPRKSDGGRMAIIELVE